MFYFFTFRSTFVFPFWQNLQNLEPLDDCLTAQTKENKKKNRYKNVVPCRLSQSLL